MIPNSDILAKHLAGMVRFATVLDFDYDPATYDAVRKQGHLLQYISKERIQVELNKILLAAHPARGLEDLYTLGMYPYIIPMMCHTVGFAQRGGHHFLDVFEHSLLAVGVIAPEMILSSVLFPEPLVPMIPTISPLYTSNRMPFSARSVR